MKAINVKKCERTSEEGSSVIVPCLEITVNMSIVDKQIGVFDYDQLEDALFTLADLANTKIEELFDLINLQKKIGQ